MVLLAHPPEPVGRGDQLRWSGEWSGARVGGGERAALGTRVPHRRATARRHPRHRGPEPGTDRPAAGRRSAGRSRSAGPPRPGDRGGRPESAHGAGAGVARRVGGWTRAGRTTSTTRSAARWPATRDGYFADFSGTTADIAATASRGWFYDGRDAPYFGGPRGTDPSRLLARPIRGLPSESRSGRQPGHRRPDAPRH